MFLSIISSISTLYLWFRSKGGKVTGIIQTVVLTVCMRYMAFEDTNPSIKSSPKQYSLYCTKFLSPFSYLVCIWTSSHVGNKSKNTNTLLSNSHSKTSTGMQLIGKSALLKTKLFKRTFSRSYVKF